MKGEDMATKRVWADIQTPNPPTYRWQDSLDEVFALATLFVNAIEKHGGIDRVWQGWTLDRQRDFCQAVIEIEACWIPFAAKVKQAAPKTSLSIVKDDEAI
jgi:hypothetical protein